MIQFDPGLDKTQLNEPWVALTSVTVALAEGADHDLINGVEVTLQILLATVQLIAIRVHADQGNAQLFSRRELAQNLAIFVVVVAWSTGQHGEDYFAAS